MFVISLQQNDHGKIFLGAKNAGKSKIPSDFGFSGCGERQIAIKVYYVILLKS